MFIDAVLRTLCFHGMISYRGLCVGAVVEDYGFVCIVCRTHRLMVLKRERVLLADQKASKLLAVWEIILVHVVQGTRITELQERRDRAFHNQFLLDDI